MEIEQFLAKLKKVKKTGDNQWTALCPAHDDKKASLSISLADEKILLHCHAGCDPVDIVSALGLRMNDLFNFANILKASWLGLDEGGEGVRSLRHAPVHPSHTKQTIDNIDKKQDVQEIDCDRWAGSKQIPVDFLEGLGISDYYHPHHKKNVVRIPYFNKDKEEISVRFRLSLEGKDRFRWKTGDKPFLYGLWRFNASSNVILCEGESDSLTLWFNGFNALGVPGVNNWKDERDAPHLKDIETIYVVIEPDTGGQAFEEKIRQSSIKDRVKLLLFNEEHKDPSELYLSDPARFKTNMQTLLDQSISWTDYEKQKLEEAAEQAWNNCKELAQRENILDIFEKRVCEAGLAGELENAKLLYLILTSRMLEFLVSGVIEGTSSTGKSYLLDAVLKFFPEASYLDLTAFSEKSLIFTHEDLSHRFVILYEMSAMVEGLSTYLIRSILSEGRIKYLISIKKPDGTMDSMLVEREGPTALLMTTTSVYRHAENETRVLAVTCDDTRDQTAQVLLKIANRANRKLDFSIWKDLQIWLEGGEKRVVIPYAEKLAKLIKPVNVRLRRDFGAILSLIESHALLQRATRGRDSEGRIIASFDDYRVVFDLTEKIVSQAVDATVRSTIKETVNVVGELIKDPSTKTDDFPSVNISNIAKKLNIDRRSAQRRVSTAIKHGYLTNLETKKGRPAKIAIGEPLPSEIHILPTFEELRQVDGLKNDASHFMSQEKISENNNLVDTATGGRVDPREDTPLPHPMDKNSELSEEEYAKHEREAIQRADGIKN